MQQMLREHIRHLSARPGVYLFKDARGRILYVGKARILKARVSQYLDTARLDPAKREMVQAAAAVDTIVTHTEAEALALEASLIQRHEPPYNVRLVDDSSYVYVRIARETVPHVELVRRVQPDGAWYRGPYPSATSIRRTLKEARKLFPWCSNPPTHVGGRVSRVGNIQPPAPPPYSLHPRPSLKPCFAYHLGLCPGICAGATTVEEYQRGIESLKRFLDGDVRDALRRLRARMTEASQRLNYERAAKCRDAIRAIEKATTPQHVVTPRHESVDALGLARRGTHAVISVLSVRAGRVTDSRAFPLIVPSDERPAALLRSFLLSFLARTADGAPTILLPEAVEDGELLTRSGVFSTARAPRTLTVPRRGWKRRLLELARTNAEEARTQMAAEQDAPAALQAALRTLAQSLHLAEAPHRIEAYDVSNIQGVLATGSMVVFQDGKPKRSAYRKFKIRAEGAPNDVAMMKEMLQRRFGRHAKTREGAGKKQTRHAEWPVPDLIIVDGGKGQLGAGRAVLHSLRLSLPIAALAKREEELFVPVEPVKRQGNKQQSARVVRLERTSPALYLLQRLRDEAHRFTRGYHQLLRRKRMTRSVLDEIPGVGEVTRKKLLRAFGSTRAVRAASRQEVENVVGHTLAQRIARSFHGP